MNHARLSRCGDNTCTSNRYGRNKCGKNTYKVNEFDKNKCGGNRCDKNRCLRNRCGKTAGGVEGKGGGNKRGERVEFNYEGSGGVDEEEGGEKGRNEGGGESRD